MESGDGISMEVKKDLSLKEFMQLQADLEELQQTHDMIHALSHFDVDKIKTLKRID